MYHFGFLIKCSFKGWESFWTVSLPRNSWAGPPRCSGHAGPRQDCHGFFWALSKPRWTEGGPDQDPVAVLWLTPKHSHFERRSSHAPVLMEICLNNIMLLQPFWGLIQSPLRWDNAHWFQWAVNYTFYFRLKSSFFFCSSLSLLQGLKSVFSPKSQILPTVHIPRLDHGCSEKRYPQPAAPDAPPVSLHHSFCTVLLIKPDISHFSCNTPNQLFIIHTEQQM